MSDIRKTEETKQKIIRSRADLTTGQKIIFDFIFCYDHILFGFNNIQVNMLGQAEEVRQEIARFNVRSDIYLVKNNQYPPGEIRDLCSNCLKKANLSYQEDSREFWQFLEEYYVRALTFNYNEAKVKQSLIYDIKTMALHSNLDTRHRYFGYSATQHLQRIIARYIDYSKTPPEQKKLQQIGYKFSALLQPELLADVKQEALKFDQEVLNAHRIRSVATIKLLTGLVTFAIIFAAVYFGFRNPILTVFLGGFGGFLGALMTADPIGNSVQKQNIANDKFLKKELEQQLTLVKKSIVLKNAKYIDPKGEVCEVLLVRNDPIPNSLLLDETKQTAEKPIKFHAKKNPIIPIGQRPTIRAPLSITEPEQAKTITFLGGLQYNPKDNKCLVRQLQHPSNKLFGFLDVAMLKEHKVDSKEIKEFQRVLDTGKIIATDSKGQAGIKLLSTSYKPIWFFSWGTKQYEYGTTKIKITSTGARVLGHRVTSTDTNDSSALEVYDTYRNPRQAHRK